MLGLGIVARKGQARRVVRTEISILLDWVVKPDSWVSEERGLVLAPRVGSSWASGALTFNRAGVGQVIALDGCAELQ
ncbi:hypothetical protein P7K49_001280 [Saguinus oedipus]|uniref:Uncharacterized protein n=1 Tax=Saguinus oedipus TaxID=9490 RepID=A0ABQ9WE11_SAGOE|nr:hypothetical protein P7K49_001280 [Saguinus oedipus]